MGYHAHEVLFKLVEDVVALPLGHAGHPTPLCFHDVDIVAPLVGGVPGLVQDQTADMDARSNHGHVGVDLSCSDGRQSSCETRKKKAPCEHQA